MLKDHMSAIENHLIAISEIPANSEHTLHKGTPREAFIQKFLQSHLSERVAVGTGEIIDANSRAGESRNQFDLVIYNRNYPKLDFGGGVSGFLAESVVATIEVKSRLNKNELLKAVKAARNTKKLNKNIIKAFYAGYTPPSILNYVVAYKGPAKIDTVYKWIPEIYRKEGINQPILSSNELERIQTPSSSIDGIFLLGKGFLYFCNIPLSDNRLGIPDSDVRWVIGNSQDTNLLYLFIFLTLAASGVQAAWLDPTPYLGSFEISGLKYMP